MNLKALPTAHRQQRGVAIITAILVIALGTITMVAITATQQLDMQRERNEGIIQQARAFGISGERFAAALLYRDRQDKLRGDSDSLEDDWALTIPPVPIDNASIQGCIVDMQGRFNLNNLVNKDTGKVEPIYKAQFVALLGELALDIAKADAVIDWIDTDIDFTDPDGAEDDYYTGLEVGYRTANALFTSVSELQLVKGFRSDIEEEVEQYEALLPHIAALPLIDGPTPINVNTATPEVLASMSDRIQPEAANLSRWTDPTYEDYPDCENIFDLSAPAALPGAVPKVPPVPWETIEEFNAEVPPLQPVGGGAAAPATPATPAPTNVADVLYDIKSRYFQVRIDVEAEGITLSQYTLLERFADGETKVVYRSRDTL